MGRIGNPPYARVAKPRHIGWENHLWRLRVLDKRAVHLFVSRKGLDVQLDGKNERRIPIKKALYRTCDRLVPALRERAPCPAGPFRQHFGWKALLLGIGVALGVICVSSGWAAERTAPSARLVPEATAADTGSTSPALVGPTALRRFGVKMDTKSYERALAKYLREKNAPSTDTEARRTFHELILNQLLVQSYAREKQLDRDADFRRRLSEARRELLFQFVLEQEVLKRIAITTESLKAYYQAYQADFTEPEKVQVRHILTESRETAEQARDRLVKGDDFAKVAAEMSIHPSGRQGGVLPPFSRGTYQAAFEKAAFGLKVGELSPVVETDLGFHVIEKTSEVPPRVKPFAEVAPQIRRLVYERERQEKTTSFLETLRRRARDRESPVEGGL